MKICLYLEFYNFLNGALFKKVGTGLLSSYKNQKSILDRLNISFTEKWDASCDILQINTPWLKSIYLMKKARKLGKKVVIWSHVTVEDSMQVFRFMPLLAPLYKKYLTYAYGLADMVFCPSEYTKGLLVNYGLPEEKLVAMSNGVNLEKFYGDQKLRDSGREKFNLKGLTVGTIALVIPRKGIDTFIMLAKEFTKNKFIWFGKIYSGILVKSLPKNIPQNIEFTGHIENVNEAYNSLDIFIFPSYEENQGMAILEAAAIGLPIIVRDIPVYNGWLIHEENCLKAKNEEEFKNYLKLLLENENLRKKLSENAKKLALKESLQSISEKTRIVYNTLIKSK